MYSIITLKMVSMISKVKSFFNFRTLHPPYYLGKADELYPDPEGKCDIYAVCAGGVKYMLNCNGGDLFDTVSRSCQKADSVTCPGWKNHQYLVTTWFNK